MKILVVGQGGREHALVRATGAQFVFQGNAGLLTEAKLLKVESASALDIARAVQREGIDLVVIGPEADLVSGLSDELRRHNISVFGPSQAAAQLEGSKIFSKEFMLEYKIPTARSFVVRTVDETLKAAENFAPPYVLKADGLAAGKGVFICKTLTDLRESATSIFVNKSLGVAGSSALLEEFSPGEEVSVLVATNGTDYEILPLSRDHKRLLDGDEGPNTGGMGVVGPIELSASLKEQIARDIVEPSIKGLHDRGFLYRGILFIGIMLTDKGPSVLEYNVRFGDPETQVILPMLDTDALSGGWAEVFATIARGEWPKFKWNQKSVTCVVLAAEGYPDNPKKGVRITGEPLYKGDKGYILHAGTRLASDGEGVETNGGRVLNAIGVGANLKESIANAYLVAEKANWPGRQMRRDIGQT
ncbi:MAG: phosphoribosylamine--glycine ligase [Bdellovibrionota bacterium]